MGVELKTDGVPHIAPVGVVVLFFGVEGHLGHEGKSLSKVLEREGGLQAVILFFPHFVRVSFNIENEPRTYVN